MNTFAILGTPRSRTAWFAKFLSYGDYTCEHEPSRRRLDIERDFVPGWGASDSTLTLLWRRVIKVPKIHIVVVMRPIAEVIADFNGGKTIAMAIGAMVGEIAAERPDIPIISYATLTPERCAWVFRYLLGEECPKDWLQRWVNTEVLADIDEMWLDVAANREGIKELYGKCLSL